MWLLVKSLAVFTRQLLAGYLALDLLAPLTLVSELVALERYMIKGPASRAPWIGFSIPNNSNSSILLCSNPGTHPMVPGRYPSLHSSGSRMYHEGNH